MSKPDDARMPTDGDSKVLANESIAQIVKAEDGSIISHVAQSQIGGDVVNSIVVTAGGDVIISYADGRHESFDASAMRQRYLEAIVASERFNRWADERYIDETARPLPMHVAPRDLRQPERERRVGPKRDLIEVVEENLASAKRVLILGDPGAGKTTALERLAYLYARRGLDDVAIPLPVLIPLNRYDGNLVHVLRASLNEVGGLELNEEQTDTLMSNIEALVLFDGLNELGRWRESGVRAIRGFMAANPRHRYVVTCRTQDYRNDLEVKEAWEVQPLDEQDVERYLKAHLGDEGIELYSQIRREERLLRLLWLARNPLLLRMIKDTSVGGKLPRNRGELYRGFVKKMLWREGQKGGRAHSIPGLVKERALAQLAYSMQCDDVLHCKERKVNDCFVDYLQDWSEPYNWRELLEEIKLNGLLRPAGGGWTFTHQSLQEFFAAYALEEAGLPGDVLDDVIGKTEWNEVIFLLSGITEQGSKLVKRLLSADVFMAAKSISQGASPDHEVLQLVINRIGDMSRDENWAIRRSCADLMGEIGSPLAHPHLIRLLEDSNSEVRWGAVHALRLIRVGEVAAQALIPILNDSYWVTQGEAAMTLGEMGAVEAIPQLGTLLGSDSAYVRVSATYALIKLSLGPHTPGAEELLSSPSQPVRVLADFATQVVAHQDQTAFIKGSLKNESPPVREAAVMLLVRASKFHAAPEIASLLGDSIPSVRAAAVAALGKLQARDFTPAIARLMLEDPDAFVRESAASALDSMHARDAFSHFLRAVKDGSPGVRFVVARSLGRLGIDEARPVLRELAQTDPNHNVRLHAVRALGFLASPDDIVFLEHLHTKEEDTEVVQSICEAIDNISKGNRRLRF